MRWRRAGEARGQRRRGRPGSRPPALVFGPPPVPATRRGSAAAALGNGLLLAHGDLVLQPVVELLADPLDLDQVLGLREGLLRAVLDDRLRLGRPDAGKPRELFRARRVQVDAASLFDRRGAGGDSAAPGPDEHEPAEEPRHHRLADPLHLHLLLAPPRRRWPVRKGKPHAGRKDAGTRTVPGAVNALVKRPVSAPTATFLFWSGCVNSDYSPTAFLHGV